MGNTDDKFEEVYKTHFRDVYRYVYQIIRNRQMAEDITQDVFCAALNLGITFLDHPNQKGWLMITARNKLCEMRRRMKYRVSLPLDEKAELEVRESGFREIDLEMTALCAVSREEWKLVKEYYLGDASVKELTKKYGITENNMRVRLHRLKVKVRKAMQ